MTNDVVDTIHFCIYTKARKGNTMNETERLLTWMQRQGITPAMLAKATGIDYTYITRMLSGDRPVSDTLRWRISTIYGSAVAMRIFLDEERATA